MNRLEELPAKHHDDLFELGQDVQLIVFVQVTAQGFFQAVPGEVKIRFYSFGIEPSSPCGSDLANFPAIACCQKINSVAVEKLLRSQRQLGRMPVPCSELGAQRHVEKHRALPLIPWIVPRAPSGRL